MGSNNRRLFRPLAFSASEKQFGGHLTQPAYARFERDTSPSPGVWRLKRWLVPAIKLLLAVGIVILITTNWNAWNGGRLVQETDDARSAILFAGANTFPG